jgi:hypothetical protein
VEASADEVGWGKRTDAKSASRAAGLPVLKFGLR